MANIAEGFARRSQRSFKQFLLVAKGSAAELQSHLYIVLDQGHLSPESFASLYDMIDHCARQMSNLIKHLSDGINRIPRTRPRASS